MKVLKTKYIQLLLILFTSSILTSCIGSKLVLAKPVKVTAEDLAENNLDADNLPNSYMTFSQDFTLVNLANKSESTIGEDGEVIFNNISADNDILVKQRDTAWVNVRKKRYHKEGKNAKMEPLKMKTITAGDMIKIYPDVAYYSLKDAGGFIYELPFIQVDKGVWVIKPVHEEDAKNPGFTERIYSVSSSDKSLFNLFEKEGKCFFYKKRDGGYAYFPADLKETVLTNDDIDDYIEVPAFFKESIKTPTREVQLYWDLNQNGEYFLRLEKANSELKTDHNVDENGYAYITEKKDRKSTKLFIVIDSDGKEWGISEHNTILKDVYIVLDGRSVEKAISWSTVGN